MESLEPLARRHADRNFWLGVANGAVFNLAETLMDPSTVLAAFVRLLGGSPVLVGLLFPIRDGLWFLPQIWVSSFIQSWPRKLPLYNLMTVVRTIAWGVMAALIILVRDRTVLLAGFFVLYLVLRLAGGLSGLSFMDVVAKTVPPRRRGQYFGWRNLGGGVLSIGVGYLVAWLIGATSPLTFPENFGALVLFALVAGAIGMVLFAFVIEPPEAPQAAASLRVQMRKAGALVRDEANYRRFLALRIVLLFAQAALAFFEGYASQAVGLPEAMIGVYLTASTIAGVLANPVWGRMSEHYGNRRVLRVTTIVGGLALLLVPVTGWLRAGVGLPLEVCAVLFALAFALARIHVAGTDVAAGPLLLDMAPAGERSLYIGATNTVLGIALLSTSLSGEVVESFGYTTLFVACLAGFGVAGWLAWRIADPRHNV
jgi:predicted MFS family arabinose efflux permease